MPQCWTRLSSAARLGSVRGNKTEMPRVTNFWCFPPASRPADGLPGVGSLIPITGGAHLLSNQPHLVGGEAVHHAAVVDVALSDDDIRHDCLYPLPAMPWHVTRAPLRLRTCREMLSTRCPPRVNDLGVPRSGGRGWTLTHWRPPSTNWPWVKPEAVKRLGPWPHSATATPRPCPLLSHWSRPGSGGQTGPRAANFGILISCPTITSRVGQKPFACFKH